jgi:hypothetical protein
MKQASAALLVIPVVALACGGGESPTTPTPRAIRVDTSFESTLPAHAASCVDFRQEASGEASAGASLDGLAAVPIEMGVGSCAGTRSVVARGDGGAVTATLPVGDSFLRVENTGDSASRFRLTLRYLRLF